MDGWTTTFRAGEVGFERAHREWEPALAHAVARLTEARRDELIALGAGHSHVTTPELFAIIETTLASAGQVVLLRPVANLSTARAVLRERCRLTKGHDWYVDGIDWLQRWLSDGLDERLATDVVLTAGDTPEQTAAIIATLPVRR